MLLQESGPPVPPPPSSDPRPSSKPSKSTTTSSGQRRPTQRKRKPDEACVERDKRGQIIKACGIGDCKYRTGSSGELKRHRANRHDIDVTWYPCDQKVRRGLGRQATREEEKITR